MLLHPHPPPALKKKKFRIELFQWLIDPTWYTVVKEQIAVKVSFGLFPGNEKFAWA